MNALPIELFVLVSSRVDPSEMEISTLLVVAVVLKAVLGVSVLFLMRRRRRLRRAGDMKWYSEPRRI